MVRINLLPREVLERRRYEKWYVYIVFGFAVLLAVVLLVWAMLWFTTQTKEADLQLLQEQAQKLQVQADAFGVFEKKEQDFLARQAIADSALKDRINVGRVAEEVSLVLPDEVWLQQMSIGQEEGLLFTAFTPYSASQSMDVGYKSVAKTLVRLNELPTVQDVWLTSATNADFTGFVAGTGTTPSLPAPTVTFQLAAKVLAISKAASSSASPSGSAE